MSNFDQYNNSLCLQLPWEKDDIFLTSWREGCTGYPWIDASIRQLRREGWIHHCLRLGGGGEGRDRGRRGGGIDASIRQLQREGWPLPQVRRGKGGIEGEGGMHWLPLD